MAANVSMQSLSWDLTQPNQQLAKIADRQGIPYLDLLPVFQQAAKQPNAVPLYFKRDGHWMKAGHALTAEAVFDFVVQEDLIRANK